MHERSDDSADKARLEAFDWVMRLDAAPDHPAIGAAFRAWLMESDDHAAIYAQTRRVWEAAPRLSPAFADHWHCRALMAPAPRRRLISRRQWLVGAAAAATAAAFAAGPFADLWADYTTGTGETERVTLADSSVMALDTDTAVRVVFGPARRGIELLRGRAFFEVAHDSARPFAVAANGIEARALGTRFEVRREDSQISVAVAEGSVAVSRQGRDLDGALKAGEAMTIELSTSRAQRTPIAPQAIGAWRDQRLVVDGWSVAAVLEELGRYHRGMIVLRDEALGARLVSGTYDLGRPADAVRAVALSQGGTVTAIGPWLLVVSVRP